MNYTSFKVSVFLSLLFLIILNKPAVSQQNYDAENTQRFNIGYGWAKNSVNAVIFRQSSVTSFNGHQYTAYYDSVGTMILARRKLGNTEWKVQKTSYSSSVEDAHNAISIGVDGKGMLHVAWGMHGDSLRYARSVSSGSLTLTPELPMTGKAEGAVTYPRFFRLSNGDLLFMYRHGSSGSGDIMLNRYHADKEEWVVVRHPLIDGEGERNAYVNSLALDGTGGWHISWTWRETWDVATNHDIMYAYSPDEGSRWMNSKDERYDLPITSGNAEVVYEIPQGRELINQTSMTVTGRGDPVIATYWREKGSETPQFRIVWRDENHWRSSRIGKRTHDFSLSGGGTKRIPVSRPLVMAGDSGDVYVVFRDFERGGGISVATSKDKDYSNWTVLDIYRPSIGLWEPTFDSHVWNTNREIHLFGQFVGQGDNEQTEEIAPQEVFILKWIPSAYR